MRKSRFTDSQILAVLKQGGGGATVPDLCREYGISTATFYQWRPKCGGTDASVAARMKALELAVADKGMTISLACRTFGVGQRCYRCKAVPLWY